MAQTNQKYSWLKAPRYDGEVMEVGPLARLLVAYAAGVPEVKNTLASTLKKLGVGPEALYSTLAAWPPARSRARSWWSAWKAGLTRSSAT